MLAAGFRRATVDFLQATVVTNTILTEVDIIESQCLDYQGAASGNAGGQRSVPSRKSAHRYTVDWTDLPLV